MEHLISSPTGGVHLVSAIFAMIFGTAILLMTKGSKKHKKVGYLYVISMFVMLLTSFFMYSLFGRFSVFHIASIFSSVTLLGGMIPIWRKKPVKNYRSFHFSFMYWSVIGLYAAFFSEVFTRVPSTPFFGMVAIATFATCGIGAIVFKKKKLQWQRAFGE
jgi:uncharacterized membrane protein